MAEKKFLDQTGTETVVNWAKEKFVQHDGEKGLTTNDFTDDYKATIDNIPSTYVGMSDYLSQMTKKVDKEDGKGLSTNDFTTVEKTKLGAVESGAQVNKLESIKVNGIAQSVVSKGVDITVPTKTSELTNDSNFVTASTMQSEIQKASTINKEIVDTVPLPANAKENTIYLKKNTDGASGDVYSEYLLVNGAMEKIGTTATEVDLSGYLQVTDVTGITLDELNTILNS